MKIKQILTILLAVFVVGSLVYMISKEQKTKFDQSETSGNSARISEEQQVTIDKSLLSEQQKQKAQLIVYYFHGGRRCPTCYKLETYAKEALDAYFADEIASKKIVWKVVNVDRTENSHFIQDYKLVTKSVVLSEVADGKEVWWKNLDQIWQRVRDKDNYLQYIRESILNGLEGKDS